MIYEDTYLQYEFEPHGDDEDVVHDLQDLVVHHSVHTGSGKNKIPAHLNFSPLQACAKEMSPI